MVAFTATQIPGIADRIYPASLAGPRYPDGIRIRPEEELTALIRDEAVDEVVFAYSDVSGEDVMHAAASVLAAGADFTLQGPRSTMVESAKPVVAVCAVRTGCGKSQTSLAVGRALVAAGLRVGLIRHPMPYHDLEGIRVQRFETVDEIDASNPTIEEREEYERPVSEGIVVYAGVDYEGIVALADREMDVLIWDGGNNDFPFLRPDLLIVVADPLRAGDEMRYHPGEANLRMADVVLVNKVDGATPEQLERVLANVAAVNPGAEVLRAESPVSLDEGPSLEGRPVLVVDDGPTITHGGMAYGAGAVAARRPARRWSIRGPPRSGRSPPRWRASSTSAPCFRRWATPMRSYATSRRRSTPPNAMPWSPDPFRPRSDHRLPHPIRHATYELRQVDGRPLDEILAPIVARGRA